MMNYEEFMDAYGNKKVWFDREEDGGFLVFSGREVIINVVKNTNCETAKCVKIFWGINEYDVKNFDVHSAYPMMDDEEFVVFGEDG